MAFSKQSKSLIVLTCFSSFVFLYSSAAFSLPSSELSFLPKISKAPSAIDTNIDAKMLYEKAQQYSEIDSFESNMLRVADLLTQSAELDYGPAQIDLAHLYMKGFGVVQSNRLAAMWFQKAADQGFSIAQYNVANLYHLGIGIEKDDARARYYYRLAANQGVISAQFNLALMYRFGLGGEKNPLQVARWFDEAAKQGHGESQYQLAKMYAGGEGVYKNYNKAQYWLKLAIENGVKDARKTLQEILPLVEKTERVSEANESNFALN